jgi:exopolysaccharide biosynthesis polyprenyl glycosylphosphotransferase
VSATPPRQPRPALRIEPRSRRPGRSSLPPIEEWTAELESTLRALDLCAAGLVFVGALGVPALGQSSLSLPQLLALGTASAAPWPVVLRRLNAYSIGPGIDPFEIGVLLARAGLLATAALAAVSFLIAAPLSPRFVLACGALQLGALAALRLAGLIGLRWLRRSARTEREVLIVGSGPRAAYVREVIERGELFAMNVIGFVDDDPPPAGACVPPEQVFKLSDVSRILRERVVDEVIVACPRSMLASIEGLVDVCAAAGVPITLLSDLFGDYLPTPTVRRFGSMPALRFAPVHHNRVKLACKRAIDIVGAGVGLALCAPILGVAALAIKLSSPGPVLFRQLRCTLYGRPFPMFKLRTMYMDAEQRKRDLAHLNEMDGPVFKMRSDPRVTPVGRWLRRFSLDEIPQFWNVLRGDLSLVGPRPPVPEEVVDYKTFERRRLSMRPGITCLWQVSGRNEIGFEDWIRLDLEYIDTWSLGNDLRILLRTLPAVLRGTGAS